MFWTMDNSEGINRKRSIDVNVELEEVSTDKLVNDLENYPVDVVFKQGNGVLRVYLSQGEADALAAQLNAVMMEIDRKQIGDNL